MASKIKPLLSTRYNLIFLFPEVYKPLKANFAKEFELLSETSSGYIFTLCSEPHKNLPIAKFRLYSERIRSGVISHVMNKLWVQIRAPLSLLWRRPRVDAIIAWDPYTSGLAGSILKMLFRTKLIVEVVGDYHKLEPSDELVGDLYKPKRSGNALKKLLMRVSFRVSVWSADAIKVVNTELEEFFMKYYPIKRLYRFPCFVASDYFQSLECYQGNYFLSIGHPFHRKGIDVLIQAFKLISTKHPAVKLKIMGYAPERELESYKVLAQADSGVEFIRPGWIEDVAEQMRGCYALVHAARSDAAPRVLFEAMACRKPIVATRTSGGIDYVRDGQTGLLCKIEDVQDLAAKMDYLLSSPNVAAQMGQCGFERLQDEFSEEKYTRSFLTMVGEVVRESSPSTTLRYPKA